MTSIREQKSGREVRLCLASDFFFPSIGGIETHAFEIAKAFVKQGIKHVIVVTRNRDDNEYIGEKMINDGTIKVYYLKRCSFGIGASLPSFWWTAPEIYRILKRENITHVHCHQTSSTIGFEVGVIACLMGIRLYLTEHSLFSLGVIGGAHLSATISPVLHCCDKIIAVSDVQAENIKARCGKLDNIVVIPNGIDTVVFHPPSEDPPFYPTVVVVTRFEKRRGGNFLPFILKSVLEKNDKVRFVIAGGGSLMEKTESIVKEGGYGDRVELLGEVKHNEIPDVMRRGHFFLNCSLTDSFCVSIVEAAACGLYVISTDVGGISDTLPSDMISLVPPCCDKITDALLSAINERPIISNAHRRLSEKFDWESVAKSTIKLYELPHEKINVFRKALSHSGPAASMVAFLFITSIYILLCILDLFI
jgi:phosphatidylinositol glycan class A protein